jgi:hypothetical protein
VNLEHEGTDSQLVAFAEPVFALEAHTVDPSAVAAAQVAEESAVGSHAEHAVLPADRLAKGADVTPGGPTEEVLPGLEHQARARRLPADDDHPHCHGGTC